MRILNDEEIKKYIDDWFLKDMDAIANRTERPNQIDIAKNIAKAQHQLDLKDFIWLVKELEQQQCYGFPELREPLEESLKQLAEE